jgi:hypothetical protein
MHRKCINCKWRFESVCHQHNKILHDYRTREGCKQHEYRPNPPSATAVWKGTQIGWEELSPIGKGD